jgi:heme o synthase
VTTPVGQAVRSAGRRLSTGTAVAPFPPVPAPRGRTFRAYLALTKPRIIELLLVTTAPTMVLAARGLPGLGVTVWTLLGGTLAAGSANTWNCYLDRDIDRLMQRTAGRPLATGELRPRDAAVFGTVLGLAAVAVLGFLVNLLSAGLALFAIAFYVLGYTLLLKRRTSQNIVWGGVAGCVPVLIGWTAVTGRLDWTPFVLFGVVFWWTPAHYWPLSLTFRRDYTAAGVPMLGAVAPAATVARRVVGYAWATVACSLLLIPVAGVGPVYTVAAVLLGAAFLREAHLLAARARREEGPLAPMRVFHASISYLALLFAAVAVDPLLPF